ncbi:hypothetical protein HPP92_019522 [Vanilla planifolia]|uniref:Uncharacterized protein n=1 Tax=Vanilla planifolia TaxID=51239 RepID=A0A835Q2G6_VANPL|nr:hypothetical protein HPP92_019522 [Vanilla planifolia]
MASSKPTARPLVSVQHIEGDMVTDVSSTVPLPDVLRAAIRPDICRFVHDNLSRNKRQPYAVSKRAGHQTSAESWGYWPSRLTNPSRTRWRNSPRRPGCLLATCVAAAACSPPPRSGAVGTAASISSCAVMPLSLHLLPPLFHP